MDATDLEVALTMSTVTSCNLSAVTSQPTANVGAGGSTLNYGRYSAQQHHSYFAAQAAAAVGLSSDVAADGKRPASADKFRRQAPAVAADDDDSRSDYTDFESVGSNSNPGY